MLDLTADSSREDVEDFPHDVCYGHKRVALCADFLGDFGENSRYLLELVTLSCSTADCTAAFSSFPSTLFFSIHTKLTVVQDILRRESHPLVPAQG